MGLMSRFHEIEAGGNRLNKIMFIGDDDWHQPGGKSPLKWRAVSFVPREETRRLNLYAARLISSSGTLQAADYMIRQDTLTGPSLSKSIRRFDMSDGEGWTFGDQSLAVRTEGLIELRPAPHTNTFALSPEFDIPEVGRLGFSVEMDVSVPERYNDCDPSHKAWASTYLELLNDGDEVTDVIKISVCRPRFGNLLASAGEVPPETRRVRIRLVGSHQSYLSSEQKANMDGEMICRWRNLEVFESTYPTQWEATAEEGQVLLGSCSKFQVRATLLADDHDKSPILQAVIVGLEKH